MRNGMKVLLWSDGWMNLALGTIGPIYAIFVEKIGGDILDAGWAYFAYMGTAGLVMYAVSHWENRSKHKEKLVILGYSLMSLGCLSYIFVSSQMMLVITQIILGLSEAVLSPAYDTLYSKFLEKGEEASEWGDWEAMHYAVSAIAAILGGLIVNHFGFKVLFSIMFGMSLLSIVAGVRLFKKERFLMHH